MAAIMEMLIDSEEEADDSIWPKAPSQQEWAELLLEQDAVEPPLPLPRGQVLQITREVLQEISRGDASDSSLFRVEGKDKSWFLQKGAIAFKASSTRFRLNVTFQGSSFGDDYAELSRSQQAQTINWLIALGVVRKGEELTGYQDCKTSGFYFIFHANYRRTRWRIIACPHNAEIKEIHRAASLPATRRQMASSRSMPMKDRLCPWSLQIANCG
ncbi:unnamed protein product [Effrenium voratum]|nr:unnamed protein product [Effrenium voratum]